MKTCTGTEKLTRGWWVNQTDLPLRDNLRSYIVDPGTVFWTDGIKVLAAPPGRELVGFTIRNPTRCEREFPYATDPGAACRFSRQRFVWPTYAEALSVFEKRAYVQCRILPVTRRKRNSWTLGWCVRPAPTSAAPDYLHGNSVGWKPERFVFPTLDTARAECRKYVYGKTFRIRRLVLRKRAAAEPGVTAKALAALDAAIARDIDTQRKPPPTTFISLSDALDDQLRGCLRIPRPSACPSFFSENDHEAFQRMWHGNDSVCLSDLMDKKP